MQQGLSIESLRVTVKNVSVVAVAVNANTLTETGMILRSSPIFANVFLNLSPQVFTQCASSTTSAINFSLYIGDHKHVSIYCFANYTFRENKNQLHLPCL